MNNVLLQQEVAYSATYTISYMHALFDEAEQILQQHRIENPGLYRLVEEQKAIGLKEADENKTAPSTMETKIENDVSVPKPVESIYFKQYEQEKLKIKIAKNQKLIHEQVLANTVRDYSANAST